MHPQPTKILKYASVIIMLALLCPTLSHAQKAKWHKWTKTKTHIPVAEIIFEKGSVLKPGTMLMWGEWILRFNSDTLPCIKPYAPVESYTGKAFAIAGFSAYSTHQGPALAEMIYDNRAHNNTWSIDVWQPNPKGGAPLYHMSFYITGPEHILLKEPAKK